MRPNCWNAESGEPTPAVLFEGCFTPSLLCQVWEGRWRVIPHDVLPDWLKDNDFLLHGHRPPMPSFRACFKSIFRIHTETGNIWTHLLGNGADAQSKHASSTFSNADAAVQIRNAREAISIRICCGVVISGITFSFDTACKADCARLGLHLAAKRGYCATVSRGKSLLPDDVTLLRMCFFPQVACFSSAWVSCTCSGPTCRLWLRFRRRW